MPVLSLGYLRLRTPKLDEWRTFATDVLGLMSRQAPSGCGVPPLGRPPVPVDARTGGRGLGVGIGFEVGDDRDLRTLVTSLDAAGVAVDNGAADEAAQRLVSGFASFADPAGAPIELFHGPILSHELLDTPLVSGFVTGEMGLGHVVIKVPDLDDVDRLLPRPARVPPAEHLVLRRRCRWRSSAATRAITASPSGAGFRRRGC